MIYRRAKHSDIEAIMRIIKQAQAYLKSQGINQWQNNYPNIETTTQDIIQGYGYVLEDKGQVIATAAVSYDGEPTYDQIHDGEWLSENDYVVIHRVAVDSDLKGRGLSAKIIEYVEKDCQSKGITSFKVDTHEQNTSMQKLLKKTGFSYCGIIYLDNGDKRLAFEKILND